MFSLYTETKSGNSRAIVLLSVHLQFCCLIALLRFVARRVSCPPSSFGNLTYSCLCPFASGLFLLHVPLHCFVVCNQWDTSTSVAVLLLTFAKRSFWEEAHEADALFGWGMNIDFMRSLGNRPLLYIMCRWALRFLVPKSGLVDFGFCFASAFRITGPSFTADMRGAAPFETSLLYSGHLLRSDFFLWLCHCPFLSCSLWLSCSFFYLIKNVFGVTLTVDPSHLKSSTFFL